MTDRVDSQVRFYSQQYFPSWPALLICVFLVLAGLHKVMVSSLLGDTKLVSYRCLIKSTVLQILSLYYVVVIISGKSRLTKSSEVSIM